MRRRIKDKMNTSNSHQTGVGKVASIPLAAVDRRRMLLKGVGKGAAVLAAAAPIKTLAGQNLLTFDGKHQCSVSGMQSGVHSAIPASTPICGGYSPGWWGQADDGRHHGSWSNPDATPKPRRAWPSLPNGWTYNTPCKYVFNRRSLPGNPSLFQVMNPPDYANTDEFHWICAWLNALSHSFNFPYTGQQVIDLYNSPTEYHNALTFFKTYMETHAS
jgi:hypothetical protein